MRRTILATLAIVVLGAIQGAEPAEADSHVLFEVFGVKGEDMLKMRAGPGIGYRVIVGLPNGTVVRVLGCPKTPGPTIFHHAL
jgi:hypothetical protein